MDAYQVVKTLHIISATVLFGTGIGIAFFMFRSHFAADLEAKLFATRTTVVADYLFTAPAAILQPATGVWLIWHGGFGWAEAWLVATYAIYVVAGLCWLPVVWIQARLRNMAAASAASRQPLPPAYDRLFRIWFALGWPAFIGLVIVFFLMVIKPL